MTIENLTPQMERILKFAEIEAGKNKDYIGVNHVLVGIMLEGDNYGSLNLKEKGFTVDHFRYHA